MNKSFQRVLKKLSTSRIIAIKWAGYDHIDGLSMLRNLYIMLITILEVSYLKFFYEYGFDGKN